MKVLIFSLAYEPFIGGAEIAVKEITDRLPEIEWEMVTLNLDGRQKSSEKIGNIHVYRIGGPGYFNKILFIPRAAAFALRREYDLGWCLMTYMLFPVALARLLGKRTPYVLTLQDGDPFEHVFRRWFIAPFNPLLKYGFRHAVRVQAISNFLAGWAKRMGSRDVIVVPNGADLERFKARDRNAFDSGQVKLITTSRLVEKNGIGDIIEALALLPETVSLRIVGSGPLEAALKRQAQSLGLESRVAFLGEASHDDIAKHLEGADIFIRPSLSEGQGISFIEAMAAGLPVVATPVGGIPDFLTDGETGLFCEPHNPQSIAEAVMQFIADGELRERVRENALKMVQERYDWNPIAQEMKTRLFAKV